MMSPRVMFTLIICKVFHPGVPFKRIHILCIFFTSPKLSHFHCSRSLPFDGVFCDANGCCVIAMHRYFWLHGGEHPPIIPGCNHGQHQLLWVATQLDPRSLQRRRILESTSRPPSQSSHTTARMPRSMGTTPFSAHTMRHQQPMPC